MIEVTQDFNACRPTIKAYNFRFYLSFLVLLLILYTPEILNINIEQAQFNMHKKGQNFA